MGVFYCNEQKDDAGERRDNFRADAKTEFIFGYNKLHLLDRQGIAATVLAG